MKKESDKTHYFCYFIIGGLIAFICDMIFLFWCIIMGFLIKKWLDEKKVKKQKIRKKEFIKKLKEKINIDKLLSQFGYNNIEDFVENYIDVNPEKLINKLIVKYGLIKKQKYDNRTNK